LDWAKLPDLAAVAALTCAFASVARRGESSVSRLWLWGWLLITLHFAAFMMLSWPGNAGLFAANVGLAALVDAGILFMYASVPYRNEQSSKWMLFSLIATSTLYVYVLNASPTLDWALTPISIAFGGIPLTLALYVSPRFQHALRWIVVGLFSTLSVFLLIFQHRPGNGGDLALNGLLFAVYFGCCLHVWYAYRRMTAGALITIFGFFGWALVFVFAPLILAINPAANPESEVWNLPKYIVAVGMMLLLLEDQVAHNRYLALHDELTGLPNRRLFLDRLTSALERARRTGTRAALLVVDLDQFKQVNDSLGHQAGDTLLKEVGAIFTSRIRNSDTVARTGGDEFSLILEDTTDRASAGQVAMTLLERLNEPFIIRERPVWVGASIGVALFPDDATDMEGLCVAADLRMYNQKNEMRGSIDDAKQKIHGRSQSQTDLPTDFRLTAGRHLA